jgi:ribosomal protein L31
MTVWEAKSSGHAKIILDTVMSQHSFYLANNKKVSERSGGVDRMSKILLFLIETFMAVWQR